MLSLDAITRRAALVEQRAYQRIQRIHALREAIRGGTATLDQLDVVLHDLACHLADASSVSLMAALLLEQRLEDLDRRVARLDAVPYLERPGIDL